MKTIYVMLKGNLDLTRIYITIQYEPIHLCVKNDAAKKC